MSIEFEGSRETPEVKSTWKKPSMRILPAKEAENTGIHSPADTGDHTLFNFHS